MIAVDLFAGAGGFSTGATMAGCTVAWAANHWPTETGEFIAYFAGDYHIGYGATASDARDALLWSMENE